VSTRSIRRRADERRITGAADLLHVITYGTRPDPKAAIKRRIAELERELAELKAKAAEREG